MSRDYHPNNTIWCVAANIAKQGMGTRHFNEGSSVYLFPDTNEHGIIRVVGEDRTTRRYLTVFVNADQLTNCQVEEIDNPILVNELGADWGYHDDSRRRAEDFARYLQSRQN